MLVSFGPIKKTEIDRITGYFTIKLNIVMIFPGIEDPKMSFGHDKEHLFFMELPLDNFISHLDFLARLIRKLA